MAQYAARRWRQGIIQLGVDLRGAGLTLSEIEAVLRQEVAYARHPSQRRGQIKSIMRTLRQGLRAAA